MKPALPALSLAILSFTACVCVAIAGCSSKKAGETLSVSFESSGSGLGMSLTTAGTAASGAIAATPDKYTGSTNVVAKVVYRGTKALVYKWSYSLPAALSVTGTVNNESLSLSATGQSNFTRPTTTPLDIRPGTGSATLEVYEKDGTITKSASTTIYVYLGYSG